jgi:hypothetical protein
MGDWALVLSEVEVLGIGRWEETSLFNNSPCPPCLPHLPHSPFPIPHSNHER